MATLLNAAIFAGPVALASGLLVMVVCIVIHWHSPEPKPRTPLLRFVLVAIAVGFGAFVAGTAMGIAFFCSIESAGNLCGLGGIFGTGPLLAGIGIAAYSFRWLKGTRNAC